VSLSRHSRHWVFTLAAVVFLAAASPLHAHAVFSTKGPFFGGLKHFGVSIDDILAATVVGIIAAQHQVRVTGKSVLALALGWYVCGTVGLWIGVEPAKAGVPAACSLVVMGVIGAIGRQYRPVVPIALAAAVGSLHGLLNGLAMQPDTFGSGLMQMLGIVAAAGFVATYPSALLDLFKQQWVRIVARVMSSWIAATGLLLLGWSLRARG
jgi:hydrogenase/urease accessory protein HupE